LIGPALVPLGHHEGKPPIQLVRPVSVIGSRSNARIHLISSTISKAHALLVRSNGRTYVRDLASRTHVIVNNEQVREVDLNDGDLIQVGSFTFKYVAAPGEGKPRRKTPMPLAMPAKLEVAGSNLPVPLEERVALIGKRSLSDVHLLEEGVSTAHAVIFEMNGQRFIRDLGSRTGTFVNGVSTHQHQLSSGDIIRIGETEMRYKPADVAPEPMIEVSPPPIATLEEEELEHAHDDLVPGFEEVLAPPKPVSKTPTLEPRVEKPVLDVDLEAFEAPAVAEPAVPIHHEQPPVAPPLEPVAEAEVPAPNEPEEVEASRTQDEEDLLPRRGWRGGALPEEPAEPAVELPPRAPEPLSLAPEPEPVVEEPLLEAPVVEQPAAPEPLEAAAAHVEEPLTFPDSVASHEEATALDALDLNPDLAAPSISEDSAAAMIDQAALAPPVDEQIGEEPALEEPAAIDTLGLEPEPSQPAELEPAKDSSELSALDLSMLQAPTEEPAAAAEETIDAVLDLAPAAPPPAEEPPAAPQTREEKKPPRSRRGRKRKKLEEAQLEQVEQVAPAETQPDVSDQSPATEELIEPTEPTLESALQSSAEALALDALASPATEPELPRVVQDELSDTKFDKAVREFSGNEFGDLVEPAAPATEAEAPEPVVEEEPGRAAAEAAAPEVPELEFEKVEQPPKEPAKEAPWGANQENFLGGKPLNLPKGAKSKESDDLAVEDLIAEIDDVAAAAEAAAVAPAAPGSHDEPPVMRAIPTPPRPRAPRKPNVFRAGRRRRDETIPPYAGEQPATQGQITTGFDGLAMPPVREMDVFSQMSPPAADEDEAPAGGIPRRANVIDGDEVSAIAESIGGGAPETLEDFESEAPPAIPLPPPSSSDIQGIEAETHVPRRRDRRARRGGAFETPVDTSFGTPLPPINGEENGDEHDVIGARRQRVRPALGNFEGDFIGGRGGGGGGGGEMSGGSRRPAITYVAEQSEAEAAAIRRKYFRRVAVLLGGMAVLIAISLMAIWQLVGVSSTVEAKVNFKNVAALTQADRNIFQLDQKRRLKDETTRRTAKRRLNERNPEIPPGFLDDTRDYFAHADKAFFTDERPDILKIRFDGKDADGDKARAMSMAVALFEADKTYVEAATRSQRALDDLKRQIEQYQHQVDDYNTQIVKLRMLGESRPSTEQLNQLEADLSKLETAWNDAVVAVKTAEAELARMKTAPAGGPAAPAPGANAATPEQDEKIRSLQAQADELVSKVNATRSANSEQASNAKKALDAQLDAFQKRVADAQGMMNGNPELVAYVQAAQKLQETTRQLTDDLIRRQEQQFARLTEMKDRLNEKMEQLRIKSWESDSQLKELNERLDILTRQYNAALGGGLRPQAEELKAQVDLTKNMIKARQDLLPGDNLYADVIKQLQVVIDSTKQNIEEDRKKTETLLTSLQTSFTSSQSIEKLPEEQKQLAASLQQQLKQINDARGKYNNAIDTTAADPDADLKKQIASLQAMIESRRHELADQNLKNLQSQQEQNRLTAIDAKNAELAKLNQAENDARQAYFAKHKELRDAQTLLADAKANAEKLDALIRQKEIADISLKAGVQQLDNKKREVNSAVEPLEPSEADVSVRHGEDRRVIYSAFSCGGILAIFMGLILWTMHTASVEAPGVSISGSISEARPVTPVDPLAPDAVGAAAALPGSNGNGSSTEKTNGQGPQEDHEPAVV
jgi:pSer/pThr/pTyr-binding forkhead associated (FHA) protein